MTTELTLFADYRQIHVLDEQSSDDLGDAWNDQASADRLAVTRTAMALGTEVNVDVDVAVEVLSSQPADDSTAFDHVVEASIEVTTGRLVVMGCTDYLPDAARFDVKPGWIRVRASRANLAAAKAADLAAADDEETTEQIRLQIWSAEPAASAIVRRWNG